MACVQVDSLAEDIARLADGADNVVGGHGLLTTDVLNLMIGLIECGADEVGHACIDDGKLFSGALLDVEQAADERATLGNDSSSQFKV